MPGTFNGKTLVISATPTAGAKIVDAGAANYNQRRHYVQCENKRKGNDLI